MFPIKAKLKLIRYSIDYFVYDIFKGFVNGGEQRNRPIVICLFILELLLRGIEFKEIHLQSVISLLVRPMAWLGFELPVSDV